MKINLFLCLLLVFIFLPTMVHAYVEDTVYVDFKEDGSAHIKQVSKFFVSESGYYLPSYTYNESFMPDLKNIQIHDNGINMVRSSLIESNNNGTVYSITIPEVEYGSPYNLYYEYDYQNVQVNYKKNYDVEFFLYRPYRTINEKVILCLPKTYSSPESYDSTPSGSKYYSNCGSQGTYDSATGLCYVALHLATPIGLSNSTLSVYEPNFCNNGIRKEVYPDYYNDYFDKVSYEYSDSNADTSISEYSGDKIFLSIPKKYESRLSLLKDAEKTIAYFNNLSFKSPDKYYISIVDSSDKVFSYKNDENFAIICYDKGNCFLKNEILRESNQLQIANVVKTILTASFVNTYGEQLDNWWQDGAVNNLVLSSMNSTGMETKELKDMIESYEDKLDLITNNIQAKESRQYVATKVVKDLEKVCPNHIIKINKYMIEQNASYFTEQKKFNNFLIYAFSETCNNIDVSPIFQKYRIEFDNVLEQKRRYDELKNESDNIPTEIENSVLSKFVYGTNAVPNYFIKGDIIAVANNLTNMESDYNENVKPLMDKVNRYLEVKDGIYRDKDFNLFQYKSLESLSNFRVQFSNGYFIAGDKELDSAIVWQNNGKTYSWILVAVLTAVGGFAYFLYKKKSIRNIHKNTHHKMSHVRE